MKRCAICGRTDVGVINEALRHNPVRVVAELHKVGKTVLGEHRKSCLKLDDPRGGGGAKRTAPAKDRPADTGGQASADKPDSAGEAADVPKFRPPRARPPSDPKLATSFDDRVLFCADMIASGQMNGHRTAMWLASVWGVGRDAIAQYRRAGEVVARADRGDTAELTEDTLGALRQQEEDAKRLAEWLETLGEFQAAGRYRELAHKARAKYAEVAGLIVQRASVSLEGDPRIAGLWKVVHDALEELDQARAIFLDEVGSLTGGAMPAAALPVPSEYVTKAVRAYEAQIGARKGLAA